VNPTGRWIVLVDVGADLPGLVGPFETIEEARAVPEGEAVHWLYPTVSELQGEIDDYLSYDPNEEAS
jgi:hypothetical protein